MNKRCSHPVAPRIRNLTAGEYRLAYQEQCRPGTVPQGEGDILLIDQGAHQLRLFIPAVATLRTLFAPNPVPDSLLLPADVRQALMLQHIEQHDLQVLDQVFSRSQMVLIAADASAEAKWFYGVATSLGEAALCGDAGLISLPPISGKLISTPLPDWRLPLIARLGWSTLPLSALDQLEKGDLVQVTQRQQWLTLAGSAGGAWRFDETGIVSVEAMDDMIFQSEDVSASGENGLGKPCTLPGALQDVELNLEVVLGEVALPLTQAATLAKGAWLPLSRGGVKATRLRLGNQTLACGELVEIDGELGVILDHIYYRPAARGASDDE